MNEGEKMADGTSGQELTPPRHPMTARARRGVIAAVVMGVAVAWVVASRADPPVHRSAAEITYCALVKSYKGSFGKVPPVAGSADVGSRLAADVGLIEQARNSAPEAIRGEMEIFAGAYSQVAGALADAKFRPEAVSADALQPFQTPAFESALREIANYDKRVCGIG